MNLDKYKFSANVAKAVSLGSADSFEDFFYAIWPEGIWQDITNSFPSQRD